MARISINHTTPTLETVTRKQILDRVVRECSFGQRGTATGGDTTSLIDTGRLQSTQYTSRDWVNGWAVITEDAGGSQAAPEGELGTITAYDTSAGDLTIAPALSAGVASGDAYQLWRYPHPQDAIDIIDDILTEEAYFPCWTVLSDLPDHDMEASGVTPWGTASSVTASKISTAPRMWGKQWLSLATTSANGYLPTETIRVEPNHVYSVSALVMTSAASTTAKLLVYDETNSAEITPQNGALTSTRQFPVRLHGTFITPATCHQITLRLSNVENSVTSYWDEVHFHDPLARSVRLPWWIRNESQIKAVFRLAPKDVGGVQNLWDSETVGDLITDFHIQEDPVGASGHAQLVLRYENVGSKPLFILGSRNETAYADWSADTKHVDENFMVAAVAAKLFDQIAQSHRVAPYEATWVQEQRAVWAARYQAARYQQEVWSDRVIQYPPQEVAVAARRAW